MDEYPRVVLKPHEEGRLQAGHPWVFSNEISKAPAQLTPGSVVDLVRSHETFLGRGFYHPHSLIAFRQVTDQKEPLDRALFLRRFSRALEFRESLYPGQHAYRWIFGESDRLPGLIVDRYGDYLVVQILAAGMEAFKEVIISIMDELLHPKGIVIRSDSPIRKLEGLPEAPPDIVLGQIPERVEIATENGRFVVDLLAGQKTGFYFDQRENRKELARFCAGKRVLDAFCYSGGFGISAAKAGARQVVFADSAEPALMLAKENAELNQVGTNATYVHGDALKLLEGGGASGFDVISIDPPAYARNRKHVPVALKAYEKLNVAAMTALSRGGLLATSSCSHLVSREKFLEMLLKAARKSHRSLRVLALRSQAKDHPVLLAMPETEYLKFAILEVL